MTRDEVDGLVAELLMSGSRRTDRTGLEYWLNDNTEGLGLRYVSELGRNFRL